MAVKNNELQILQLELAAKKYIIRLTLTNTANRFQVLIICKKPTSRNYRQTFFGSAVIKVQKQELYQMNCHRTKMFPIFFVKF